MRALRVIGIAFLTAIAGAVLSVVASLYLTELYHVSNFEGGRGMLIFFALAPLGLMASAGRTDILRGLARIHVFRERLPMMHRDGWTGPKASNAINHTWFVWSRGHLGPGSAWDRISIHPTTPKTAHP